MQELTTRRFDSYGSFRIDYDHLQKVLEVRRQKFTAQTLSRMRLRQMLTTLTTIKQHTYGI